MVETFGEIDQIAVNIGAAYVSEYPTFPPVRSERKKIEKAFETMEAINRELFDDIPIPVQFTEDDPYDDYQNMRLSVAEEGILKVFSGGDPHPIWDQEAEVISRAVHDWYGHLQLDVPFTIEGEYAKWDYSRSHYPAYCDRVLFTEVIGQLGAAYYLDDGFADDQFEQKVFAAPPEWIEDLSMAIEREADQ